MFVSQLLVLHPLGSVVSTYKRLDRFRTSGSRNSRLRSANHVWDISVCFWINKHIYKEKSIQKHLYCAILIALDCKVGFSTDLEKYLVVCFH